MDNAIGLRSTEFISECPAVSSQQQTTQLAKALRAPEEMADDLHLPLAGDYDHASGKTDESQIKALSLAFIPTPQKPYLESAAPRGRKSSVGYSS
jgi:hypothetical protein